MLRKLLERFSLDRVKLLILIIVIESNREMPIKWNKEELRTDSKKIRNHRYF